MKVAIIFTILCYAGSAAMYLIGKDSSHLSELLDFFWIPLVPAVLLTLKIAVSGKGEEAEKDQ